MALSYASMRRLWSPACRNKGGQFIPAYKALDSVFRRWGYKPRAGVTGAHNCRRVTGGSGFSMHAYGPGDAFRFWTGVLVMTALAVDVNWDKNPYGRRLVTDMPRGMVEEILAIRTNNGKQVWQSGIYYTGNKDAMHYEIVCSPADLATGIRGSSVAKPPVTKLTPKPPLTGASLMYRIYWFDSPQGPAAYRCLCAITDAGTWLVHEAWYIATNAELAAWHTKGLKDHNTGNNPTAARPSILFFGGPCDNTKVY